MTHHHNTEDNVPWWQSELLALQSKHAMYLRKTFPALRADHDDLIGDAAVALTRQIMTNAPHFPSSWFLSTPPENEDERSYFRKLALVILKRRIADLFRRRRREPPAYVSVDAGGARSLAGSTAANYDRQILLAKMVEVTSLVLDEMPVEDRDLIALVSKRSNFRRALNDKERQRLHRIRNKLRSEIAHRLGADVADLLRIRP